MPATLQPVIVTPSLPLLLAFYKALLGAVEISRMPEDGPAFYVGLQLGNAELGVVADGDADVAAPQRILLNVNVADLGVGDVESLLEHVDVLGGRVLGPPNDMAVVSVAMVALNMSRWVTRKKINPPNRRTKKGPRR